MTKMNLVIFYSTTWMLLSFFSGCQAVSKSDTDTEKDDANTLPSGEYLSADVPTVADKFDLTGRDTSDSGLSDIDSAGGPAPIAPEDRIVLEARYSFLSEDGNTLFLNRSPRGLQVIDVSNPQAPSLLMERRFTWDTPSMYLHGDRLVVVSYEIPDSGVNQMRIHVFDVSDPGNIEELSDTVIDGEMRYTALIGGNGTFILYASQSRDTQPVLASYAIDTDGRVFHRDTVSGVVCSDLWASENYLVVSYVKYIDNGNDAIDIDSTTLTPVDISSGDGMMTAGEPVRLPGVSVYADNLDITEHTLLVSDMTLAYDIADVSAPAQVDWDFSEEMFGASLIEGTRDTGILESESGLLLVGGVELGLDSPMNVVRIYNSTDTSETPPVIAEVILEDLDFSFLSATVAENAIEATAPDGTLETGLYVIPFWDSTSQETGIQLVTFSASTLTVRGRVTIMEQDSYNWLPPRNGQVVGVSNEDVVLFDVSDVATPVFQSRVLTAAIYTDFAVFGETGFRLEVSDNLYGGGYEPAGARAELQIISAGNAPGNADPEMRMETNASQLHQVGDDLLVGVNDLDMSTVDVFDSANPAQPVLASRVDSSDVGIDLYADYIPQSTDNALIFTNTQYQRGGESAVFVVLDLRNPEAPVFHPELTMPEDEFIQNVSVRGTTLFFNYKQPVEVEGDARTYARYYYKTIELADPAAPVVSDGISIPGRIIDVDDDFVYTRDEVYGAGGIHGVINQLRITDGVAVVENQMDLGNRQVLETRLLDNGYVLVNHRTASSTQEISEYRLSLLNTRNGLQIEGDLAYRRFGELLAANSNHAVLRVGNGVIVMDLSEPAAPVKSHYFPLCGNFWFEAKLVDNTLYVIQGGIYQFEL